MARLPQDDTRIDDTLAALNVADKAARRRAQLSQGERQRVAIARAVVNRPKLLLATSRPRISTTTPPPSQWIC